MGNIILSKCFRVVCLSPKLDTGNGIATTAEIKARRPLDFQPFLPPKQKGRPDCSERPFL